MKFRSLSISCWRRHRSMASGNAAAQRPPTVRPERSERAQPPLTDPALRVQLTVGSPVRSLWPSRGVSAGDGSGQRRSSAGRSEEPRHRGADRPGGRAH
eukprot:scaffold20483_cov52-Phaeocystis_antarctica.AAC.4